ncbi:MAG: AsnC family protein, partial [Myxococcota bacterium]
LKAHLPDAAPSMEEQILTRRFLEHMFSECDDIDQQLSVYLFVDGLSQGEAAELLGLSRSTINKRVQALREAYRWMEAS